MKIKELKKVIDEIYSNCPEAELTLSVDVSTGEKDAFQRVYVDEIMEWAFHGEKDISLYFKGEKNWEEK